MLAGLGGAGLLLPLLALNPPRPPRKGLPPGCGCGTGGTLTSAPAGGVAAGTTDRAPCPQAPVSDAWGLGLVALLPPTIWVIPILWTPCCRSLGFAAVMQLTILEQSQHVNTP